MQEVSFKFWGEDTDGFDKYKKILENIAKAYHGQVHYLCYDPKTRVFNGSIRLPKESVSRLEKAIEIIYGVEMQND